MHEQIERVFFSEEQIQSKVKELTAQLSRDYEGKNPLFIGVLKGVVMFFSDIVRNFEHDCEIDFMCLSSYSGTQSRGVMQVIMDLSRDITGRHVVILEDIYDTGNTLNFVYNYLSNRGAASVEICTLLDKPERRNPNVKLVPKYVGYVIPDAFVVGYGLDYNENFRNLPYIGVLKPEAYQK